MSASRLASLLLALLLVTAVPASAADDSNLALRNDHIELQLAPHLGGRAVHFSVAGETNLLRVGAAVREQPAPRVAADADNIPYLGHEIWSGPQSGWWLDQDLNRARRDAAAIWPPDPWQAFGRNRVLRNDASGISLQGPSSPVSGLQITQHYALSAQRPDTLALQVEARNVRDRPVARDIWFNTRVAPTTRVFVPAQPEDVRVRSDTDDTHAELQPVHEGGLFSLALPAPPPGKTARRGKVFIQPAAGWIAGFAGGQLFLIRFDLQPRERIHPEQGQVELYLDWYPGQTDDGLMELEVHAPFRTLQPGEGMSARETWTALRYDGPDDAEAQRAFLRDNAAKLGTEVPANVRDAGAN